MNNGELCVTRFEGNNTDNSSSMFWTGEFSNGDEFELELRYGSVLLHHLKEENRNPEIVIGHTSDFPNVYDVIQVFAAYIGADVTYLTEL